jgi:hypothetical protein
MNNPAAAERRGRAPGIRHHTNRPYEHNVVYVTLMLQIAMEINGVV